MLRALVAVLLIASSACATAQGWEQVSPWGIQQAGGKWIAGRTTDAIEVNPSQVLVSTDGSGVWLLQRALGVALSREWDSTNIACLAAKPGGGYFAGGVQSGTLDKGVLYQTKPNDLAPLLVPWEKIPLPAGTGTINRIAVLDRPARIVLATDTGILWSSIPGRLSGLRSTRGLGTPGPAGFVWQSATGSTAGAFYDVEKAGAGIVVTSRVYRSGPGSPIRLGSWQGSQLVLADTTMRGTDSAAVGTTSVCVSPSNPQVMYAMCGNRDGAMLSINRSEDGGQTWQMKQGLVGNDGLSFRSDSESGRYGDFRSNTVAVSPADPNTVLVGWTHAFVSHDGGDHFTWTGYTHDDHARFVYYGSHLYDCCDGGVMVSSDDGATYSHDFNQKLANLQFYPSGFDAVFNGYWGLGGGLQDNNVAAVIAPRFGLGPWQFPFPPSNDGGDAIFLAGGAAFCDNGGIYKWAPRTDTGFGDVSLVGHPSTPSTFLDRQGNMGVSPKVYRVFQPTRRNAAGEIMVAVAYRDETVKGNRRCHVYGLYQSGQETPRWEPLLTFSIPSNDGVCAIASYSGDVLYVGFAKSAQIWKVDVSSGQHTVQTGLPDEDNYLIGDIITPSANTAYATRNQFVPINGRGGLYALNTGDAWSRVAGLPDETMDGLAATSPQLVMVGTENAIYRMQNNRNRWENVSSGLPKAIHPTSIRIAAGPDGRTYAFLATYGWSVWRMGL